MGDSTWTRFDKPDLAATSPIDLFAHRTKPQVNEPFQFVGFNKDHRPDLVNTGNTVQLKFKGEPSNRPRLSGGGLPHAEYYVDRVQFKWDSDHTVNNIRFPLEAHLILRPFGQTKDLAVLAILFKYGTRENAALNQLLPFVPQIANRARIPLVGKLTFAVGPLLPENTHNYFRYDGSLTVPPHERCLWSVFAERNIATREQVFRLTSICDEIQEPVVYNHLLNVELAGRIVYFNGDRHQCKCLKY